MIGFGFDRHVTTGKMKFELVCTREVGDKFFVLVGFSTAQRVIEVNDGQYDAEFVPKLEQQAKQTDRVGPSGNRNADAITSLQQVESADVIEGFLRERVHEDIVQPGLPGDRRPRLSRTQSGQGEVMG